MSYITYKKKNKIFLIFCISILTAIPFISTAFPLRNDDPGDKENPISSSTFITTVHGKKYLAEYITREKVEKMKKQYELIAPNREFNPELKKQSELKVSNKNSNQIIDGHGTGYIPPSAEELENLIGKISLIDVIPEAGSPKFGASADISTEIYFPVVGDQAMQGSCTAWANTYYAYGYMEAKDYGWDASSGDPDYLLSPAWVYNKVAAYDYGSEPVEVAQLMIDWGVATLSTMPYNDSDVDSWGNEPAWREAPYHRPLSYNPIIFTGPATIDTIKGLLDSGIPVTFGIDAYQFYYGGFDDNWILSSDEYEYYPYSLNHAQCFVGYNDAITDDGDVGAFKVVNSWGIGFADSGYYWLTYDAFSEFAVDPYQAILYYDDRIDYNPSLISTWEFSATPTRMDDIITLGVGLHESPFDTIIPLYDNDRMNQFPEFMALDISEFQSYYDADPEVFFFLEIGSSTTTGTISSFLIERYIGGVLQEISPESLDTPKDTPSYVYNTFKIFDHELKVSLEVPQNPEFGEIYIINATVSNYGINTETNVDLHLFLDNVLVNSTSGVSLPIGSNKTIIHTWNPSLYKTYNFTAYTTPVAGETYLVNNIVTKLTTVPLLENYTMTPGIPFSWIDASGGKELTLNDDDSVPILLPFDFTYYDQTFLRVYLCSNGYLSFTDQNPWDFVNVPFPSANPDHTYMIAPFWDDLDPWYGGHIYVESFETYWVAEWLDIYHIDGYLVGSFEVILYETGGIVFNYDYLDYIDPYSGYTCGLNLGVDTNYYNSYLGLSDLTDNFSISFTYPKFEHDLKVSLKTPVNPQIGDSYRINATVTNNGLNEESDVDLFLYLEDLLVNFTTISNLPVGASETVSYIWTPPDYGTFDFTVYAPPVFDELLIENNFITEKVYLLETKLFDGMYTNYNFIYGYNGYEYPGFSSFSYAYYSGITFMGDWWINLLGSDINTYYDVDCTTRVMTNIAGSALLVEGHHDPGWIFTDINLGDNISIAFLGEEHLFNVSDDLICDLSGYGPVEVWILEDLTIPGEIIWYEKSTGILLEGTFITSFGYFFTFNLIETNVQFTYISLDHELKVSLEVPINLEIGNSYIINATVSNNGLNDEYDIDLLLYLDDILVNSTNISTLSIGANETISYIWVPPDYGTYNFTAYALPIPDELLIENNFITEIIHLVEIHLFDGMFINYDFSISDTVYTPIITYSNASGNIFHADWYMDSYHDYWDVDAQTRVMSNSGGSGWYFGNGFHTPFWIFTDVALGDQIKIAVDGIGDHLFFISNELIYYLPGVGVIEVWELEDLTIPGGIAWYEKSTGILLNGTFLIDEMIPYYNYTFEFVDTNIDFEIYTPDSITITNPDSSSSWEMGTSQNITWTSTGSISDVKIELYKDGVLLLEIVANTSNDESYTWAIPTNLEDGIDYQIKISDVVNPDIYDESPNFVLTSEDISGDDGIPSYNLYILISLICIVSVILINRRFKLIK